jgi:hypothetical protein
MNNYKVQIALGPERHVGETLAEYLNRCSKNPKGVWDERRKTYLLPSGTVKQGRRPMFKPFTPEQLMAFADHIYAASEPIREDAMTAEDRKKQLESPIEPDYEPEQSYGSADDFRRHQQYGGTREDY